MPFKTVLMGVFFFVTLCPFTSRGEDLTAKNALSIDLSRSALSWETGGLGLTLSYERILGEKISLLTEGTYMDLADAPGAPRLILASLGLRYYFSSPAVRGFFAGFYPMAGAGIENGHADFLAGFIGEMGYIWRVGRRGRITLEPYIQYPYFIDQPLLIGIAPGISLGLLF